MAAVEAHPLAAADVDAHQGATGSESLQAHPVDTPIDTGTELVPFPLLVDKQYDPNTFDYLSGGADMPSLAQWVDCSRKSAPGFRKTAEKDESVDEATRKEKAAEFEKRCDAAAAPATARGKEHGVKPAEHCLHLLCHVRPPGCNEPELQLHACCLGSARRHAVRVGVPAHATCRTIAQGPAHSPTPRATVMYQCDSFSSACSFTAMLDILEKDPAAETPPYGTGKPSCLRLVLLRDWCLHDAGFADPWKAIKEDELQKALELLPEVRRVLSLICAATFQSSQSSPTVCCARTCALLRSQAIYPCDSVKDFEIAFQQDVSAGATRGGRDHR